jgi:tetratricopeptide (TPR) repeat protein
MRHRFTHALQGALLALPLLAFATNAVAQESDLAALRAAPATDAAAQLRLGRALRRAGHFDEALRALRTASRGPTRADALFEVARVGFDRQNFPAARTACNAMPAGITRRVCLARAHLAWRRVGLAEQEVTAAQAIDANYPELRLVQADLLWAMGRITEAEPAYRAAATALPGRSEPHIGLGTLYETASRLDEARQAFQRAVEADPRDPVAALALGRLLRRQGQNDQALPLVQRANTDRPDWPDALVVLGELHLARNTFDEAQRAFARAAQLNPHQASALSGLGRVHLRAGRTQEAEAPLRAALELVSNDADAREALAELLGRTERGEESIQEWDRVIEIRPTAGVRMRAAAQARSMRLNTLARAYLDRVLSDEATHAEALLMRADIAFDDGDRRAARQLYQQAIAGRGAIDRARAQARIQEIDAPQRTRRR